MMKLYLVHVGFYDDQLGMSELHAHLMVAAMDIAEAKQFAKEKAIFMHKGMHINSIQEVTLVDGYRVRLEQCHTHDATAKTYEHGQENVV